MRTAIVTAIIAIAAALVGCDGTGDPASVHTVDCKSATSDTTIKELDAQISITVMNGDVVQFALPGGMVVEPGHLSPDDSTIAPALKSGANAITCVQFDHAGTYGFHAVNTIEGTVLVRSWIGHVVFWILDSAAIKWLFLVLGLVMPLASLLTWAERRQSAMMQDRLGPNRANIGPIKLKGILHFVADALKMIFKEDFVPANVHKGLYALAPILALAPVLIAFCIIPFGPTIYPHAFWHHIDPYALAANPYAAPFDDSIRMQIFQIDYGLIFYFAVLTLANYGGTIAGWASYNKWALLGGLRSSSQMMSYEVAMGLSLMPIFLAFGTLEPGALVNMQGNNPVNWGLLSWSALPGGVLFTIAACLLFFTAAIAETKRAPFDIPEGEPEIIGYFVEYSGMRWGIFFLAEFIEVVFISAVIATVFFGGWQVPFLDPDGFRIGGSMQPITDVLGHVHYVNSNGVSALYLPHFAVALIQVAAFGIKLVLLCWLQLAIRWTLPRFRADQLMKLGWKLLLPLALANIMVTALVKLIFMGN
jgi:NADH-quinone oxidoreductase subunit H